VGDRWPRAMPVDAAAEYCGIGTTMLRRDGPKPVRIGEKRLVWMKEDLDAWLDRLAGKTPASGEINPWDAADGIGRAALS
jgi:hypothetical protein